MVRTEVKSAKIKLCFIIAQLEPGGSENQLLALVQGLEPEKYEIQVGVLTEALAGGEPLRAA